MKKYINKKLSFKKIIIYLLISLLMTFSNLMVFTNCSLYKELKNTDLENTNADTIEMKDGTIILEKISVASLKGPSSIGMAKLHNDKPSLSEGINVNYEIVSNPDIMISKLLSSEIDMATLPTNVAVKLFNKGMDIKLLSIVGYGVLYMVFQNTDINDWSDLKNKTIYVTSKGSTPDIILRYLLEENGFSSETDVKIDYSIEQIELSQLMIAGRVDIAVLPEPFVTLVLNKNQNTKIAFDFEKQWQIAQNGLPLPMTCFIANKRIINYKTSIIDEFLSLYEESINWVNKNPIDAAELVEKLQVGMDKKTAIEAIPRCNISYSSAQQSKEAVNNYIKVILDFSPQDVGGKMPDESFYYE